MASIQKVKTGYRVREAGTWRTRDDGSRYRDRRVIGIFPTKREAIAAAAAHETKLRSPGHVARHEMTCGQWADLWLKRHRDQVRESTWVGYESVARIWWAPFADVALQQLQPSHLETLVDKLRARSPRTARKVWSQTVDMLTDAMRKQMIDWNPATAVDGPVVPKKIEEGHGWWEPATVTEFLAFADPSNAVDETDRVLRSAICFNFHAGLRPGELAGLKWSDRAGSVIRIRRSRSYAGRTVVEGPPKTANGHRDVAVSDAADRLWRSARQVVTSIDGYVFAVDGVPVESEAISQRFSTLQDTFLADHEVRRLRFYDTRHVAITMWLKAGIDTATVSRMAGHSSFAFTVDTYREVLPSDLTDAAAKMAGLFG
jgi:integrase